MPLFHRRHLLGTAMSAALLWAAPGHATAPYPNKPIRWIVPFPPGGAMDGIARALGDQMAQDLGQPVVIDNKPGSGGNIGVDLAAKAPPDGHTMVITSVGMVTNAYLYRSLSYDPVKDFVPVSQLAVVPNILVIHPDRIKARSVSELVALARAQPGKFSYASAGNGTSIHLAGELFTALTSTQIEHVAYRGSGPAIADLLGGQVDMMFDSVASARPHVKAGKLIALGVTTSQRSAAVPDVPTLQEAGITGYELVPWFGVFMPAGTPSNLIQAMNKSLLKAMKAPEVKSRFAALGADSIGSTPEEFAARLETERASWGKLIRERNIRAD